MSFKETIQKERRELQSVRRPYETVAFLVFSLLFLQNLFFLVVQLLDATKPTYEGENAYNILMRDRARSWLTSSYGVTATDRDDVCDMAGINPESLTAFTKKLFNTNEIEFVRKRINAILHETIT